MARKQLGLPAVNDNDAAVLGDVRNARSNQIASTVQAYTLALTDQGMIKETLSTTAVAITIPTNANVAFPVNTLIQLRQAAAGQITVAGAAGVTLRTPLTLKTRAQWSSLFLHQRATDEWVVEGDAG